MAEISITSGIAEFTRAVRDMPAEQLIAQSLVQQGAVHAVSFLAARGGGLMEARDMLASLRQSADIIRAEAARRGTHEPFPVDQVATASDLVNTNGGPL